MTESMCDLMRMRKRTKTWRKRGVDEYRRMGKIRENGVDIIV